MLDNTTYHMSAVILLSYLLGSIPWAFIIVKVFYSEDLRKKGTGNIGAMNSFEITGKKWIGIAVFILDFLKGIASILLAKIISNDNTTIISLAGFFVILGHNFSVFMKFMFNPNFSREILIFITIAICILILIRHIKPLFELFKK